MGAGHSRPESEDKVFYGETPIEFSPDVVNHLSDQLASPDVPPSRQSTLDEQVRSRIQQELGRLRDEEQHVREEIERTLEKENLDRERNMAGGEAEGSEGAGHVKSSVTLLGDVDEIRRKVDRFQSKRELEDYASIKSLGEAVATCYRNNPSTTLDCWREVTNFKQAVDAAEQKYVDTLR